MNPSPAPPLDAHPEADSTPQDDRRPLTLGRLLLVAILLLLLGIPASRSLRTLFPSTVERGVVPSLDLVTFDGDRLALDDLRGQAVVINFWASWCGPCRAEAGLLEQGWRSVQGEKVLFVGVALQDTEEAARAFVAEYGVSYPTGLDAVGTWDTAFGVRGLPETFFVDAEGRIVDRFSGALPSLSELVRRIEPILP